MSSLLSIERQERVIRALHREYAWLGVTPAACRECVEAGDWDDRPAAGLPP